MKKKRATRGGMCFIVLAALVFTLGVLPGISHGAPPVVKTVPWAANNPLIPHDTWSGKTITLKGTSSVQGANIQYFWDFGDGSPVATGTITNMYAVQATHAYTGSAGMVFTATLTVKNTSTGESGSQKYYVKIEDKTLPVEVNVAIDEGLWYLHKAQIRSGSEGYWQLGGSYSGGNYYCATASIVNAFEVNGHLEIGSPDNPYTDTVSRGMRQVFNYLATYAIYDEGMGNPDSNANGYGVYVPQDRYLYQGGMFMDAIISSGTPDALTATGPVGSGANPGIRNRKYKDIVQDMVDFYAFAQYNSTAYGGWRYNLNDFPDNSACQWAAIGMIPAERNWMLTVPAWMKTANNNWLTYSQDSLGRFGYQGPGSFAWGAFATTPSGLVQLAMNGKGRGDPRWDKAESFLRNNFTSTGGDYNTNIKKYYYGLFSFVKAMLTHDSNNDGISEPIQFIHSSTTSPDIDWYSAQTAKGDPSDGVARTLVNDQQSGGSWPENPGGASFGLQTPFAIIMLQRTLFEAGGPVAVAKANPNPAVAGQTIQLDGSDSYHQDGSKLIDSWDWDLDNDGIFETSGPFASVSFPAVGNYPVKLKVSDNGSPEKTAETVLTILVTTPPVAPTAKAGGPYNFCPGAKPWFLDGTGSTNPDEGQHEPGQPGDTIVSYEWDLDGDGQFDDATGPQPDVTAFFNGKPPGSYLIQLKVTDRTATSFPSSGFGNLSDTDTAVVVVLASTDPICGCVDNLEARAKPGKVQLTWTHTGAHHYNVYRGTIHGGPYLKIASTTSTYSVYIDFSVMNGTTYYYVVREANFLNEERCQSNEGSATPRTR
jgi:hypothetical protein